jgi:hypothetical protein
MPADLLDPLRVNIGNAPANRRVVFDQLGGDDPAARLC